jgi:hypothetical protein
VSFSQSPNSEEEAASPSKFQIEGSDPQALQEKIDQTLLDMKVFHNNTSLKIKAKGNFKGLDLSTSLQVRYEPAHHF